MNWFAWLLVGLIIGWLIEFVIDYFFWQRRCAESEIELNRVRGHISELEARSLASDRDTHTVAQKLKDTQGLLGSMQAELASALSVQETLRNNIQILEDRVDNWGRKIGLLAGAGGLIGNLGLGFSQDEDEELKTQIGTLSEALAASQIHLQTSGSSATDTLSSSITPDPLHEIIGIGAVFEKRLNDAGIMTFQQLVEAGTKRIHEVIAPKEWQTIDTQDWIVQANEFLAKRSES